MSWLQNLTAGFVLRNLLTPEVNPHKVLDVKTESFSERPIITRDDAMVLYGPRINPAYKDTFEIILQRPCTETLSQAYSLYRSPNLEEGRAKFNKLNDKVPYLVSICRDMNSAAALQKVCDALEEHPTWTLAHICASFTLDCFMDPVVKSVLNTPDETGSTPIHIAIKTGNLRLVHSLIQHGAAVDNVDQEGNSVFHYAALANKGIITALSKVANHVLNHRNANGLTPLHVACLADKPECVKALLTEGADANISATHTTEKTSSTTSPTSQPSCVGDFYKQISPKLHAEDMKFGGTPLHWACSREVIETLVNMGCDINALNFEGRTALHVMVQRKRLECVVALLSHQAEVNVPDSNGNTPLHLAVGTACPAVVQALLVFGGDVRLVNNLGATPRHTCPTDTVGEKILYLLHAVGAPRCPDSMSDCNRGCQHSGGDGFCGVAPPQPLCAESRDILDQMLTVSGMNVAATSPHKTSAKGGRVLCLDGGGIRGLVLVGMLLELETVLEGRRIIDCFDWVAGTSTGGILALTLASGKTLQECLCLYFRMKDHAFVGSRPYPSESLESILKENLGCDTRMTDLTGPKMIITGVLADRKPVDLHLFRNYPSPKELLDVPVSGVFTPPESPAETRVWQAARASGAAPSYFRAFGRYLDGGLISNNPTLDALTEIHEYNLALQAVGRVADVCPASVVVSLGTGKIPSSELKAIDVFWPESIFDTARLYMGMTALGALLVDQATASDGRVVDRARTWCSMVGVPYYRFCPQLSEDIALDEKSDEKLVNMLWEAKSFMHSNMSQVTELAMFLNDGC